MSLDSRITGSQLFVLRNENEVPALEHTECQYRTIDIKHGAGNDRIAWIGLLLDHRIEKLLIGFAPTFIK